MPVISLSTLATPARMAALTTSGCERIRIERRRRVSDLSSS
jgi:hypothetical protein